MWFKPPSGPGPRAKVVAILNQKGGVGKTTTVFHLAYALKERGRRVLLMDLDPQANLTHLFVGESAAGSHHLFHLLINSVRELKPLHQSCLWSELLLSRKGVDLLPAGQELSGFDLTVAGISTPRQLILKRMLEKSGLLGEYDYIICDGPPTLGLLVVNILCAAQGVLVPFQPDEFSRKGLKHFQTVLAEVEEMGISDPPRVIGLLPNLVDERRKQTERELSKLQQEGLGTRLLAPIHNRVQLVKSQAQKKSVFDYQSKEFHALKQQFDTIAATVEQEMQI